jgi:MFS family permease
LDYQTEALAVAPQSRSTGLMTASVICLLGAMFYLYEFVIQVSPSVMTQQLMRDLSVDAAGLGIISSAYYYAYTPMQLPAGLLYDRFGPRILITLMILVCAMGAFFFGATNNMWFAALGRFMMGIGSAFAFIGVAMLIAKWFPPAYFAFLLGIAQFMSSVGAITGEIALSPPVQMFGWRQTIEATAVIGLVLALVVWLVVRDSPEGSQRKMGNQAKGGEMQRLRVVLGNMQTWLVGAYGFAVWGPILIFASLWGNPHLMATYHMDDNTAAMAIAIIWLGIGVGSPFIGWWSDHIGRRCMPLTLFAGIGFVAALLLLFVHLPTVILYAVLFFFGFAAGGQTLSFGLVKDNNPPEMVGTAVGFNNLAVVAGGALLQPLTGFLLRLNWDHTIVAGIPVYSAHNYKYALLAVPVCYLAATLISIYLLKETYCKPRYSS